AKLPNVTHWYSLQKTDAPAHPTKIRSEIGTRPVQSMELRQAYREPAQRATSATSIPSRPPQPISLVIVQANTPNPIAAVDNTEASRADPKNASRAAGAGE